MDPRLDPRCEAAVALTRQHEDQAALLVAGTGGQLANIVRMTQGKQLEEHLATCPRCMAFDPCCPHCRFDTRVERHGWMCPAQASRWRDVLPWNWRARHAPARDAPPAGTRPHVPSPGVPPARTGPHVSAPVATRVPVMPSGAPGARAQRATPAPAPAQALSRAYAMLGLKPGATATDARAAYRELAQQYHPDKVAHMAPEFREVAEKRMSEINAAYEKVKGSL